VLDHQLPQLTILEPQQRPIDLRERLGLEIKGANDHRSLQPSGASDVAHFEVGAAH
jgi:hypothetical protein